MLGGILSDLAWGSSLLNSCNYGKIVAQKGSAYYISPRSGGGSYKNIFYLEGSGKDIGLTDSIKKTDEELKSQEFVDELNTYVNNYNEEHKNDEDFVKLNRWKYNEGNYPIFE